MVNELVEQVDQIIAALERLRLVIIDSAGPVVIEVPQAPDVIRVEVPVPCPRCPHCTKQREFQSVDRETLAGLGEHPGRPDRRMVLDALEQIEPRDGQRRPRRLR